MQHQVVGFAGILVANLVGALDATALSVSLPTIAHELEASGVEAYWAGTSFVLSSAACQPLFPAFSNTFGRRPTVVLALLIMIAGTIVCGASQGVTTLLVGRTIQGIGGGGILAMTYTVMTDLFALRQRSTAVAINGLVWLLGTAVGPVLGGAFSAFVTWRWIFWICVPILAIALVLVSLFLKPVANGEPRSSEAFGGSFYQSHIWQKFDWIGAILFVSSLTAFLISISWGGIMFSWTSWHTLVPLIIGLLGLVTWFIYESTVPSHPLIPLAVFGNWTTSSCLFGTFIVGIIQYGLIFYLPLYYQVVQGYSAIISGVGILPVTLLSGISTALTGILISKIGKYKITVLAGWTILALGSGLLSLLNTHTNAVQWIFITAVSGLGGGLLFTSLTIAAQAHVSREHIALAAALTPFIRAIGQAVGISAGNSIIQNGLKTQLRCVDSPTLRLNAALIADNLASVKTISSFFGDPSEKYELLAAYNNSLRHLWWFLLAAALFAGLVSLPIHDVGLEHHGKAVESKVTVGVDTVETGATSEEKFHADDRGNHTSESAFGISSNSIVDPKASTVSIQPHKARMDNFEHQRGK